MWRMFAKLLVLTHSKAKRATLKTTAMAKVTPKFTIRRKPEILVAPCQPTPRKILSLSNIDDQNSLRFQIPVVQFYNNNPHKKSSGAHPATVIRKALEKVLVPYYPFAGRLREAEGGKLAVDCNGEGVLFIEADADVTLSGLGDLRPPFPCWDDLLYDVPGSKEITNSPLLLIQVTRLKCGGFVFALRLNHTMCDAAGLVQFMTALAETIHGASTPSVQPVWQRRSILQPRNPPQVKVELQEYHQLEGHVFGSPVSTMKHESFFFGPKEMATLRSQASVSAKVTDFDILSAFIWRLRTQALEMPQDQEVRFMFLVNARQRFEPPLPKGYYGNVVGLGSAKSTAGEIRKNGLRYAVGLIQQAKREMNDEHMRSVVDAMEIHGRPHFTVVGSFVISDLSNAGFDKVDYLGWGEPVYGGIAETGVGPVPGVITFLNPKKNEDGVEAVLLPLCLPAPAMARFKLLLEETVMLSLGIRSCL